jgi:large subunit ribosomal protein L25
MEFIMEFTAFKREKMGTGASRRLRVSGRSPGIIYGGSGEPTLVELDHNALIHALKKEAFHASVLTMTLDGSVSKVLLRDVQMHPWRQQVLHVDFLRVDENTRLQMEVPLHFVGEENSPAVKIDKCVVNHITTVIKILCLPKDLPEFITVDLSGLVKGHSMHVSDLSLPKGVSISGQDKSRVVLATAVTVAGAAEEVVSTDAGVKPAAAKPAAAKPAAKGKK